MEEDDDKKAIQFAWLEKNGVENKDASLHSSTHSNKAKQLRSSRKQNKGQQSRASYHTELEVDLEIDLHGFHIDDAMVEVAVQIDSLRSAGYTSMRVIHGYSNSSQESIRSALLLHLKSKWNKKVERFFQEPHNHGATCIILKNVS
jgi:DNA-nicking Smr family endonuclease